MLQHTLAHHLCWARHVTSVSVERSETRAFGNGLHGARHTVRPHRRGAIDGWTDAHAIGAASCGERAHGARAGTSPRAQQQGPKADMHAFVPCASPAAIQHDPNCFIKPQHLPCLLSTFAPMSFFKRESYTCMPFGMGPSAQPLLTRHRQAPSLIGPEGFLTVQPTPSVA